MKDNNTDNVIAVNTLWAAEDLRYFKGSPELFLYSVHDHYINFTVKNHDRLLMIADPQVIPGPSTIAVDERTFNLLVKTANSYKNGFLEDDQVILEFDQVIIIISRRSGNYKSFASVCFTKIYFDVIKLTAGYYRSYIEKRVNEFQVSPAMVLLDLPGGEAYFREAIARYYPKLIKALLENNDRAFISAASELVGLGRGFSPSGDDLIYSSLLAHNCFSRDLDIINLIKNNLGLLLKQTNAMGRHMIVSGTMGLAGENVRGYIYSFEEGPATDDLIEKVLLIGSTSGLEIAIGIIYYVNILSELY